MKPKSVPCEMLMYGSHKLCVFCIKMNFFKNIQVSLGIGHIARRRKSVQHFAITDCEVQRRVIQVDPN